MQKLNPNVKGFTVAELRKVVVPNYQRWLVQSNLDQLKESIESVGLLRCPIICKVREANDRYPENSLYVIDGNHMLTIILEDAMSETQIINCIYDEVASESDAARRFKMLNTKGKQLDHVDITNLYMNTSGGVYTEIWDEFLKNPKSLSEVVRYKYFSLATIIEVLCFDKTAYKNGLATESEFYEQKKDLLKYLIAEADDRWIEMLDKKGKPAVKPNGGSLIGFIKTWFSYELHKNNLNWKEEFLTVITRIYQDRQARLKAGEIINRDNAGRILEIHLSRGGKLPTKRKGRPRKIIIENTLS